MLAVLLYLIRAPRSAVEPAEHDARRFDPAEDLLHTSSGHDRTSDGPKFLEELRDREKLHQDGVEIIPPKSSGIFVDIDPDSVQEVEEG